MSRKEIIERMSYAFQPALCTFLHTINIMQFVNIVNNVKVPYFYVTF